MGLLVVLLRFGLLRLVNISIASSHLLILLLFLLHLQCVVALLLMMDLFLESAIFHIMLSSKRFIFGSPDALSSNTLGSFQNAQEAKHVVANVVGIVRVSVLREDERLHEGAWRPTFCDEDTGYHNENPAIRRVLTVDCVNLGTTILEAQRLELGVDIVLPHNVRLGSGLIPLIRTSKDGFRVMVEHPHTV